MLENYVQVGQELPCLYLYRQIIITWHTMVFYCFSSNTDSPVSHCWNGNSWCLNFRRPCFDREIPRLALLLQDLDKMTLITDEADQLIWLRQQNDIFSVGSCYSELNKVLESTLNLPWKMIWKTKDPRKVACFMWLLA